MKLKKIRNIIFISILVLVVNGCSSDVVDDSAITAYSLDTPSPTPIPTITPRPTSTPAPKPTPSPTATPVSVKKISVTWTPSKNTAVNKNGGGYRVYYSKFSGFNINSASYLNVPYTSGQNTPNSAVITGLSVGMYYIKVIAFSSINPIGGTTGSQSVDSSEISVQVQ